MPGPDPSPDLFARVDAIFADAAFVRHLGIRLEAAGPGWCETTLTLADHHLQQHGFAHAGVVTTLADHTAGGAARAAVPPGSDVVTIEFKVNFLAPARGPRLWCSGKTLRAGRSIVVAESEVFADAARSQLVAKCVSTLSVIPQRARPAGKED